MNVNNPFWPRHHFLFKGGAGQTGPIPAPPAPPASNSDLAVTQAKLEAKQAIKQRKGISSTVLAGDTLGGGSDNSTNKQGVTNVLLGGGLMHFDYLGL